jgi:hypothetical protein
MSKQTKREVLAKPRRADARAGSLYKRQLLDQAVRLLGYHRKAAISALRASPATPRPPGLLLGRPKTYHPDTLLPILKPIGWPPRNPAGCGCVQTEAERASYRGFSDRAARHSLHKTFAQADARPAQARLPARQGGKGDSNRLGTGRIALGRIGARIFVNPEPETPAWPMSQAAGRRANAEKAGLEAELGVLGGKSGIFDRSQP